jgi:hypothetical protein
LLTLLQTSAQAVYVNVSNVFTGTDLTTLAVAFAFLEGSAEVTNSTTFYTGAWETASGNTTGPWVAYCNVGPSSSVGQLALDSYTVVVQITPLDASPVQVVCGQLLVVNRIVV